MNPATDVAPQTVASSAVVPARSDGLDVEYVHKQLKAIVTLLTLILVVLTGWFGYGLYREAKIRHCANVEAESAPQQAACLATN